MNKKTHLMLLAGGLAVALAPILSANAGMAIANAETPTHSQSGFRISNKNLPVEGLPVGQVATHKLSFMQEGSCVGETWQLPREFNTINEFKASTYNGSDHSEAEPDAVKPLPITACALSYPKTEAYDSITNNRLLMDAAELEM